MSTKSTMSQSGTMRDLNNTSEMDTNGMMAQMQTQIDSLMSRIEWLTATNNDLADYVKKFQSERETLVKENAALLAKLKGKRSHEEAAGPSKGIVNKVKEIEAASDESSKTTKSPLVKKKKVTVKQKKRDKGNDEPIPATDGVEEMETNAVTINNCEDVNSTDENFELSGDELTEGDESDSSSDSSSSSEDEPPTAATQAKKSKADKHSSNYLVSDLITPVDTRTGRSLDLGWRRTLGEERLIPAMTTE